MPIAIDAESHEEMKRQLSQAEADSQRMSAEILWLRSSLVSILTFCNSDRPPTYAGLAEVARRALEKQL